MVRRPPVASVSRLGLRTGTRLTPYKALSLCSRSGQSPVWSGPWSNPSFTWLHTHTSFQVRPFTHKHVRRLAAGAGDTETEVICCWRSAALSCPDSPKVRWELGRTTASQRLCYFIKLWTNETFVTLLRGTILLRIPNIIQESAESPWRPHMSVSQEGTLINLYMQSN